MGSRSAAGAVADAIASGDEWLIGLGAVLVATTLSVVAATALRRRQRHAPKGW
jgi:ABC-type spermidine/putrescine transport system permease subunit II